MENQAFEPGGVEKEHATHACYNWGFLDDLLSRGSQTVGNSPKGAMGCILYDEKNEKIQMKKII